ncbi:hypothetical protein NX722_24970 [Endozoicomonas gorgoniicola]|uniref:DUF4402 domain-containing protein n=1 Tax=Endozoicomonas gorgoniicola TaxID=1234144 RepID=A0ABT3N2I0_9GAMM|nr:hypothetical protein [Endozoicomonas gorgoniicola]MCW7555819.1 hypothetical protein [Endozoicomonas gorgoniicola]
MINKSTVAFLSGLVISTGAFAIGDDSNDGNSGGLGLSSRGDLNVTMNVAKFGDGVSGGKVMIKHLDNIGLGTFGISDNLEGSSNFCIYATGYSSTDTYEDISVKIGGGVAGTDAFELTGPNGAVVNYTVTYEDGGNTAKDTAAAGGNNTFAGLTSVGLDANQNCTAENATISVAVSDVDASQAPAGSYTGTLALIIAAE